MLSAYSDAVPGNEAPEAGKRNDTSSDPVASEGTQREDIGASFGSVSIKNSCEYDVFLKSVGAWPVGDDRSEETITIPANSSHQEPYRETCPKPSSHNLMTPTPTCPSLNKMEGQAISMKISKDKDGPESILQLEYALLKNPERGDKFPRLDYDISLLNCAQIENVTEVQAKADTSLNQKKIEGCPGYQKGFALWTSRTDICRPIYCDGESYCDAIYNYERTRTGETSFACDEEYKGDLNFELCVGNGNG